MSGSRRPRLSMYARERVRQLLSGGYSCSDIVRVLSSEGITTCRQTVWRLERHINFHGTIVLREMILKSYGGLCVCVCVCEIL